MPMKRDQKATLVGEVRAVAEQARAAFAAEYRGIDAVTLTRMRQQARQQDLYVKVVKNTLARRAVDGTSFACLTETLNGPLLLAFAKGDPASAARFVRTFARENEKFLVRAVALDGRLFAPEDLARLADLPTREQALARLLGTLKAPVSRFVSTCAAPLAALARGLDAVQRHRGSESS
jgi:large subunit ribosomal protein L10